MGSITFSEILTDLAPGLALADQVKAAIEALPAKDVAKPSDYIKCAASILNAAAPLADAVAEQAKS